MTQYSNIVNVKLQELGTTLGLNQNDINKAKKTTRSILTMFIIAGILTLIGKIITSQLDAVGLYYVGVSIRDFGILTRFF